MTKTIRLTFPQWQGGNLTNYATGAEVLEWLVPKNDTIPSFEVPVVRNFSEKLAEEDGVLAQSDLLLQLHAIRSILDVEQPDKLIILGGDCSIDQEPFDYLHGKYGKKLGVIWLDAHPDISSPKDFNQYNTMVLSNLLGEGAPILEKEVRNPLSSNQVIYAGLQKLLPHEEEFVTRHNIERISPEELFENSNRLVEWIQKNGFEKVAIHFDVDVLDPKDFRMILPAMPHMTDFPAEVGALSLQQVSRIFKDIEDNSEIVGLGIAELMPWDVINFRKTLSGISIFN